MDNIIQDKVDRLKSIVDEWYLIPKLLGKDINFKINDRDFSVYDPWDYDNPPCYSIIFNNIDNTKGKISINLRDGEIIFEINCKNEVENYFRAISEKYKGQPRDGKLHINSNNIGRCYTFFGYFNNNDDQAMEMAKEYLNLISKY